jgi:hypothetical protein
MHTRREELFAEMEASDEGDSDTEASGELDDDALEADSEEEEIEDAQEQLDVSRTRH